MKKAVFTAIICLFSLTTFAKGNCPLAADTSAPNFCPTFEVAATCHCLANHLPEKFCQDLNKIYDRMISLFGSLKNACEFQHDTPTQTCIDDWNCYRLGGKDSNGNLCSGTGNHC